MASNTDHGKTSAAWPVGVSEYEWAEATNAPAFYLTSQGYIPPLTADDVKAIKAGN